MEPFYNLLVSMAVFAAVVFFFKTLRSNDASHGTSATGGNPGGSHGNVKVLTTDEQFDQELKVAGSRPVVVDFTASWCGPCKRIAPYFEQLSVEHGSSITFLKVDVDQLKGTASKCGVRSMPTFHVYQNQRKTDEMVGAAPDRLKAMVSRFA
eukprot:TRINITY_DN9636_c0_g1_i1.p1 TRINITY_DN9636_c0_g1~~TRINITY_DN9636_c0_g1_i1.p1  ORF type:complete len:152 (-),score=5.66 TRINITY_DN9636_c0_g1_i1:3-458(-)